jgi:hypothetical protein
MRASWVYLSIAIVTLSGPGLLHADGPVSPPPTAQSSSTDRLTAEEIRKLVDAGQYRDALKALARVVDLKGAAGADYDHEEMLLLKAECLLQIRENSSAMATYTSAQKEAQKDGKDAQEAIAGSMILLIQQSPGLKYIPKTGDVKTPISVLDRTQRTAAFNALFNDQFAIFTRIAKGASTATTLQPTLDAAKLAAGLRDVEKVATGSNQQTQQMMDDMADHAVKLINTKLDDFSARTTAIAASANTMVMSPAMGSYGGRSMQTTNTHRQGLLGNDAQVLQNVIDTCKSVPAGAELLANALGSHKDDFHTAGAKAEQLRTKADHVLHDNYAVVTQ